MLFIIGLIRALLSLILDIILLPFDILRFFLELLFGSGNKCPNCGSKNIQERSQGGYRCVDCGYSEIN